jgi:hypothetical protein
MILLDGPKTPIGNTIPVDMPDIDLHNFDARIGEVKQVLRQFTPDTILLDRSQYFLAAGAAAVEAGVTAQFVEQPEFAKGREFSANGVYFGQLNVTSPQYVDLPEFVAVKPHTTGDEIGKSVMKELAAHNHMNALSTTERAYVPLGIWKDDAGMPQLVTLYDHAVQTFDNIFWAKTEEEAEKVTPGQIDAAMRHSMYGLGLLNGAGVAHGDAQAKNLGIDRKRVRFTDFDRTSLIPVVEAKTDEAKDLIDTDIGTFVTSTFFLTEDGSNKGVIEMTADALSDKARTDDYIGRYHAGFARSVERLGVQFPPSVPFTAAEIQTHFDRLV